jgi:hypothetical protein
MATFGGLTFIGTAIGTIYQIVIALCVTGITEEAFLTLAIVVVSFILGAVTLNYALVSKSYLTILRRVGLVVIGIIALFTWSGLYLGPALAIVASMSPSITIEKISDNKQ